MFLHGIILSFIGIVISADADKVKVWVNGVLQTTSSTTYENWTSGDAQIFRNNGSNRIGRGDGDRYNNYFNGYLAEYHYVDGQVLDETSFGEFDDYGIWNPKQYNGTHGNAGFHLKFDDNSSASALGTDSSAIQITGQLPISKAALVLVMTV